jgi:hypothetical protein
MFTHPYFLDGKKGYVMSAVSGLTSIALIGILIVFRKHKITGHSAINCIAILALLNTGMQLPIDPQIKYTANFVVIIVGYGLLVIVLVSAALIWIMRIKPRPPVVSFLEYYRMQSR